MWLKLTLVTSWMTAVVEGWTLGGFIHLLALVVVAMVLLEGNDDRSTVQRHATAVRLNEPRPMSGSQAQSTTAIRLT